MNGYIEMKLDAGKLFGQFRRPAPKGAEDIGTNNGLVLSELLAACMCPCVAVRLCVCVPVCCLSSEPGAPRSGLKPRYAHVGTACVALCPRACCVWLSAGRWFVFFEIIGYAAVLSNLGVVIFTTQRDFFGIDTQYERLVVYIVLEVGARVRVTASPRSRGSTSSPSPHHRQATVVFLCCVASPHVFAI